MKIRPGQAVIKILANTEEDCESCLKIIERGSGGLCLAGPIMTTDFGGVHCFVTVKVAPAVSGQEEESQL